MAMTGSGRVICVSPRSAARRSGILLCALMLVGVFTGLSDDGAYGYTLTGCRFSSNVIPYSFGTVPSGYNLASSRSDWSSNSDISHFAPSSSPVRIHFAFGSYGATGWSGLTSHYACGTTGGAHNGKVDVRTNRTYTDAYSGNGRISVMSHEIGHAIGLHHVGSSGGACSIATLMNGYDSFRWSTCGIFQSRTDDRKGANALY